MFTDIYVDSYYDTVGYLNDTEKEFRSAGYFEDADRTRELALSQENSVQMRIAVKVMLREGFNKKDHRPLFYYDLMP